MAFRNNWSVRSRTNNVDFGPDDSTNIMEQPQPYLQLGRVLINPERSWTWRCPHYPPEADIRAGLQDVCFVPRRCENVDERRKRKCFLNCPLQKEVASTNNFQIDEIQTE